MRRLETRLSPVLWLWLPPDSRDFPGETKLSRPRDGSLSSARRERLCSICVVALRLRTSMVRAKQVTTPSAMLPSGHRFCRGEGVESQRKVKSQRYELRRALSLRATHVGNRRPPFASPQEEHPASAGHAGESGIEFSVSALEVCVGVGRSVTHACGASGDKSACEGAMTELRYVRTAWALAATRSLTAIVLPFVVSEGRGGGRSLLLSMIARHGPRIENKGLSFTWGGEERGRKKRWRLFVMVSNFG